MPAQITSMCKGTVSNTSGVRDDDGVVVFAMRAAEVRVDEFGFSCLLWWPASRDVERLQHCRLAIRNGMAEGFLLYDDAAHVREGEMLSLRVFKVGKEYWAKWGCVARDVVPHQYASAVSVRL